jgi:hypothetical protein
MHTPYSHMAPPAYTHVYARPPVPAPKLKPPVPVFFPLARGKPRLMDVLWIGIYAIVGFVLFAIVAHYYAFSNVRTLNVSESVIVLVTAIGSLLWYFVGGCFLGSWRSLLALLIGTLCAGFYANPITHQAFTVSSFLSGSLFILLGALIGLGYELRKQQKKTHLFFIFVPGIIIFILLAFISGMTATSTLNLYQFLLATCYIPFLVLIPFLGELPIRGIFWLADKLKKGKQSA